MEKRIWSEQGNLLIINKVEHIYSIIYSIHIEYKLKSF